MRKKGPSGYRRTAAACAVTKLRGPSTLAHGRPRLGCVSGAKFHGPSAKLVDRESSRHGDYIKPHLWIHWRAAGARDSGSTTPRNPPPRNRPNGKSISSTAKATVGSFGAKQLLCQSTRDEKTSSAHEKCTAASRIQVAAQDKKLVRLTQPGCPARRLGGPCHVRCAIEALRIV